VIDLELSVQLNSLNLPMCYFITIALSGNPKLEHTFGDYKIERSLLFQNLVSPRESRQCTGICSGLKGETNVIDITCTWHLEFHGKLLH